MEITEQMLYKYAPEAAALWLDSLPADDLIPEHPFSRRFERKMRKVIREQRRSPVMRKIVSTAKQVAVVALIISMIGFSCLMTVEAYRKKFIEVITEVFYDLTHFNFSSAWSNGTGFLEMEVSYLPDGMVEVRRDTYADTQNQIVYFEDQNGRQLRINQQLVTDGIDFNIIVDTENADVTTIPLGDVDASLIVKDGRAALLWENGPHIIYLAGDLTSEELIGVANGLTIAN